jgi:hypothetical protein
MPDAELGSLALWRTVAGALLLGQQPLIANRTSPRSQVEANGRIHGALPQDHGRPDQRSAYAVLQ